MGMENIERHTMKKVWWRIAPLLAVATFFNYLDKVNVSFAAVTMNQALGFSNTVFGAGAGFFAFGYLAFAIPSTLLLHRLGARRWICLIMIGWGLCSAATAFVTTPEEFFLVRFLLGMAEAGFVPGTILYLSYWFPSEYRGAVLGSVLFILPLGQIVGGPVSSVLLSQDVLLGLAGWQWMFIGEAIPTLLLSVAVFHFLTDRPTSAPWLSRAESDWLANRLAEEQRQIVASQGEISVWRTFANWRVWMLGAVNLGICTAGIGVTMFLALMIRSMGFSIWDTGFISSLLAILAAIGIPLWGIWADRFPRREVVVAAACFTVALGMLGIATLLPSPWALVPICLVFVGFYGFFPAFWPLPSVFLTGASAAAGIALVNIAGNLGMFTGPAILGWATDLTGTYRLGLNCLAGASVCAGAILIAHAIRNRNSAKPGCVAAECAGA
ncbi:MAG: MFS transporter [Gammaproteobacteria bacterium]|nr:MAG: MFS transporter [Gammaproteobacteria bacterium]